MARFKGALTNNEILQSVMDEYRHKHGDKPFRMADVAAWGLRTGKLTPKPADAIQMLARELSRAAREQHSADSGSSRPAFFGGPVGLVSPEPLVTCRVATGSAAPARLFCGITPTTMRVVFGCRLIDKQGATIAAMEAVAKAPVEDEQGLGAEFDRLRVSQDPDLPFVLEPFMSLDFPPQDHQPEALTPEPSGNDQQTSA